MVKLINKKFKGLPTEYINKAKGLEEDKIEIIVEDIFNINTLDELNKYINVQ